jgi:SAM-dependent methyltransferase
VTAHLIQQLQACTDWRQVSDMLFGPHSWGAEKRVLDVPSDVFHDRVTARLYDALYEDQRAPFLMGIIEEIIPLVLDLPPGSLVVEAGSGPGRILLALASDPRVRERRYRFVGWDPSPEMHEIAEEHRLEHPEGEQVRFLLGTSEDREVAEAIAGAALLLSRNVLSWIDDAPAECRRWRALMRPGGRLYAREVRRDIPFDQFQRRLIECARLVVHGISLTYPPRAFAAAFLRAFTPSELSDILARAGFRMQERPPRSGVPADGTRADLAEVAYYGHAI